MVGTSRETKGGISTVIESYIHSGFFSKYYVCYIASHCDGTFFDKLKCALDGLFKILNVLLTFRSNVFHFHVASRSSFWRKTIFIILAKLLNKKIIFHLHGAEFKLFYEEELSWFGRAVASAVMNRADVILALSPSWAEWLSTCATKPKIIVLENSIAPLSLPTSDSLNTKQLLFLGRIGARKGFWDLLISLKSLHDRGVDFNFVAGGDGEIEKAKALVLEYGLQDKVKFVGWVRNIQKLELLGSSSIFLLPSYNEGMPMSVLEAMAAGVPIVSTKIGGIPEQITDGVEGYLIEPGDTTALTDRLEMLLSNPALQKKMSVCCVAKFNRCFSTDVVLPKLEVIYDDLLSDNFRD